MRNLIFFLEWKTRTLLNLSCPTICLSWVEELKQHDVGNYFFVLLCKDSPTIQLENKGMLIIKNFGFDHVSSDADWTGARMDASIFGEKQYQFYANLIPSPSTIGTLIIFALNISINYNPIWEVVTARRTSCSFLFVQINRVVLKWGVLERIGCVHIYVQVKSNDGLVVKVRKGWIYSEKHFVCCWK